MKILCPLSLGELVDKLTILNIKTNKIKDQQKLKEINKEKKYLIEVLNSLSLDDINRLLNKLEKINLKLWKIEDDIRDCERQKKFGEHFIELARQVYITNDLRFKIKNEINCFYGSDIKEEKSYQKC